MENHFNGGGDASFLPVCGTSVSGWAHVRMTFLDRIAAVAVVQKVVSTTFHDVCVVRVAFGASAAFRPSSPSALE